MNSLKTWIGAKHGRGLALARALGVSGPFVSKMVSGEKAIPVAHAAGIERFTDGAVTRQDMFPDTWQRIWPEMAANSEQKQPPALASQAVGAMAGQGV